MNNKTYWVTGYVALRRRIESDVTDVVREIRMSRHVAQQLIELIQSLK